MDNLEDKNIDDFFRDGSEQHAFPYKESSWDKMESLIEQDKKKKAFGFYLIGLLLFLVFIGGALYYTSSEKVLDSGSEVQIATSETFNTTESDKTSIINIGEEVKIEKNEIPSDTDKTKNTSIVQTTALTKEINSSERTSSTTKNQISQSNAVSKTFSTVKTDSRILTNDPVKVDFSQTQNVVANNKNEIQPKNTESAQTFKQSIPLALKNIKLTRFESKAIGFEKREIPFSKIKNSNSNFTLGVVAGMEYSSVGFMSKTRGGYRLGAEVSYQFKNRFELTSGLVVSQKKYTTEAQNYSFSQGALMDNIMPEMVHGKCDVIEIPVEFSYYLKSFDKSSFYFSLGASTFLMRKEWYDFQYETMYDEMDDLPRSWADNGINNHLFGIGTIALGYQKHISKKLAFQVEPYFQIPFTGIGTGQVNLVSGGLQFKVLFKK